MRLSLFTISPEILGISGVDLRAAVNTQYESPAFEINHADTISLALSVTASGSPTSGVAKLYAVGCDNSGAEVTGDIDLATLIVITATGKSACSIGKMGASASGLGASAASSAATIIGAPKAKFGIQITTANIGGTSVTGSLTVFIKEWV
jgi:hypothetical protein